MKNIVYYVVSSTHRSKPQMHRKQMVEKIFHILPQLLIVGHDNNPFAIFLYAPINLFHDRFQSPVDRVQVFLCQDRC